MHHYFDKMLLKNAWLSKLPTLWFFLCSADETPYKLKDEVTEKTMNCVLEDSLKRAQTKKLFEVQFVPINLHTLFFKITKQFFYEGNMIDWLISTVSNFYFWYEERQIWMYENLWQRVVKMINNKYYFIINLSLLLFVNRACPSTYPPVSPRQVLTLRKSWRRPEVRFSNSDQTHRYLRSTKMKMWVSPHRRAHFMFVSLL